MAKWVCPNGHKVPADRNICVHCSSVRPGATADDFRRPPDPLAEPVSGADGVRWQYAIADTGTFGSYERMVNVLGRAGQAGWELVATLDKSSNWSNGEKGVLMFKRPVPEGVTPSAWCVSV